MREVQKESFPEMIRWARQAAGDSVYPLSIAEGVQSGRIFTDDRAYLFWHYCGFAYLAGRPDAQFLSEVENMILQTDPQKQRFLLITDLAEICAYFAKNPMIQTEFRKYYVFYHALPEPELPQGYTLKKLDAALTEQLSGRIVPAWSWKGTEQFLQAGTGFCVMKGAEPAAWAFSAAVTSDTIDIGVETVPAYRKKGLATCAAAAVMQDGCAQGKRLVWAHHAANEGSMKTAEALGFTINRACAVLHRADT